MGAAREFAQLDYDAAVKDFEQLRAAGRHIWQIVAAWRIAPPQPAPPNDKQSRQLMPPVTPPRRETEAERALRQLWQLAWLQLDISPVDRNQLRAVRLVDCVVGGAATFAAAGEIEVSAIERHAESIRRAFIDAGEFIKEVRVQ